MRGLGRCLWMLSLGVPLAGCVTDEIIVVTLEAGPPADHPGGPIMHCDKNADCHDNAWRCEKPHCTEPGRCVRRPVVCPMEDARPSCGCDGITYWADCLREQYGVSGTGASECLEGAVTCSSADAHECPVPGASCARLLPPGAVCAGEVQGACWMLPEICLAKPSPETWTSCSDPMICEDTCSAIRAGTVHQRSPMHGCPDRDH